MGQVEDCIIRVGMKYRKVKDKVRREVWEKVLDLDDALLEDTGENILETIKHLPKMDYLKWQLRKDLTAGYHTTKVKIAEERARGWNALRDYLKKLFNEGRK